MYGPHGRKSAGASCRPACRPQGVTKAAATWFQSPSRQDYSCAFAVLERLHKIQSQSCRFAPHAR
eukprot:2711639-Pyramimonas_sp.AAC.1